MSSIKIKKEDLLEFLPFEIKVENYEEGPIRYADDDEFVETIKDVGANPSGRLIFKPIKVGAIISPIILLRDAHSEGVDLGLWHALTLIKNPLLIPEQLRNFKILFPGSLRKAGERPFIPIIFFSKDINARWRKSCVWMNEMIGPDYILLKYKIAS